MAMVRAIRRPSPYGWRDRHHCLIDSTTESAVGRISSSRPRHIFVSGAADGRRYRCTIGSRTKTTAPRAKSDASKGEALEIINATMANPSASSNGVSTAFRTTVGIDGGAGDDPPGGGAVTLLARCLASGKGRTLSLFRRISSTSRSNRDLRGVPRSWSSPVSAWSVMKESDRSTEPRGKEMSSTPLMVQYRPESASRPRFATRYGAMKPGFRSGHVRQCLSVQRR